MTRSAASDDAVDLGKAAPQVVGVGHLGVGQRGHDPGGDLGPGGGHLVEVGAHLLLHAAGLAGLKAVVGAKLHYDVLGPDRPGHAHQGAGLEDLASHALVEKVEAKLGGKPARPGKARVACHVALGYGVSQHQELAPLGHRLDEGAVPHDGAHLASAKAGQPYGDAVRARPAHARQALHAGLRGLGHVDAEANEAALVWKGQREVDVVDVRREAVVGRGDARAIALNVGHHRRRAAWHGVHLRL